MKTSIPKASVCAAVTFALAAFADTHRFTAMVNYAGAAAGNVPTALRLSPEIVDGFDYNAAGDGTHFTITDGAGAVLPYEIDTWNPGGESLLWVLIPYFANGRELTVTYGDTERDMTARAAEVWSNYLGVWHMNAVNALGKYPNSAGDARFDGEVSSFSQTGQAGKFGQSVQIYTTASHLSKGIEKGGVFVPDERNLNIAGSFTVSAWLYHTAVAGNDNNAFRYDEIFCKRQHPRTDSDLNHGLTNGFGVRIGENALTPGKLETYGSSTARVTPSFSPVLTNEVWRHIGVAYSNETVYLWVDGAKKSSGVVGTVTDNDEPLSFGNTSKAYLDNEGDRAWGGRMDEVRLRLGTPSDAYIAAEYAAMAGALVIGSDVCSLEIDKNENFDDTVTVSSDAPAVAEGKYRRGTTVTLTAVHNATGTFRKWYGDVPKESRTNATISFTLEDDAWIYARFVHPWTILSDRTSMTNNHLTTMTDGHFTVNVSVQNAAAHTLVLGKSMEAGLAADGDTGTGTVDFGGPIWLAGDDTPWTIERFGNSRGSQSFPASREGQFRYISPGTVKTRSTQQPFHCGDSGEDKPPLFGKSYAMIIFDEPTENVLFSTYCFTSQTNLNTVIFDVPNWEEQTAERLLSAPPLGKTKFDWWDFSSISTLANNIFAYTWGTDDSMRPRVPIRGRLDLPSLRDVGWLAGKGTPLYLMPNVEEISLGGKDEETTVTNLCTYAFAGDSSLRKVTLHAAPDIRIGKRIFANKTHNTRRGEEVIDDVSYPVGNLTSMGRIPDEIHFTGQAISAEAIANLLDASPVVSTAAKPVVIHASKYQDGWRDHRRSWISTPTAAERAAYPGESVIGVYRAGSAAPSGKAVIIHRPNEWDKNTRQTFLIMR